MIRNRLALAALLAAACTDVGTDPNAVVALRPEKSLYPSIVVKDSLRDTLGNLLRVQVTALNYKGEAIPGVDFLFTSPDTSFQVFTDGVVYAISKPASGNRALVFASVGSLQARADSLFIVDRPDSIAAESVTMTRPADAQIVPDSITFTVRKSGTGNAGASVVPNWIVSFQLLFHDKLLAPTDTTAMYTISWPNFPTGPRFRSFIDTTTSAGTVSRGLVIKCSALAVGADSVIVIATMRDRSRGTEPKSAQTVVRLTRTSTCQ